MLGVGTAVAEAFGVHVVTGLATEVVKKVSKSTEGASSGSGSNISSSTGGNGKNVKDFIIPSILEKELSPLEMILNYEIILCVLILVQICIIILIVLHKLYNSSGLNIISKIFSKKIAAKYEKFKKMIDKIGTTYLIILIIINVILILFYIFVLIFANVELSNNIDAYIDVHLKMNKGAMMLLLVNSNFIVNKNKIDKFKYFNVSSILQKKKKQKTKINSMWDTINPDELYKKISANNNIRRVRKVYI
jgi:hypothetical protein